VIIAAHFPEVANGGAKICTERSYSFAAKDEQHHQQNEQKVSGRKKIHGTCSSIDQTARAARARLILT
jgi:hypothetical protein